MVGEKRGTRLRNDGGSQTVLCGKGREEVWVH